MRLGWVWHNQPMFDPQPRDFIEIVPYNPDWPTQFAAIGACLRSALGNLALRIDHIGSTSVPGLPAKDILDIQVTAAQIDNTIADRIARLGYIQNSRITGDHLPPGFDEDERQWRKLFFNAPPGQRHTHIHVRASGNANQRYPLLFRDYLRAHPASAAAYAELKRRLALSLREAQDYPNVKDPAVDLIYLAAEEWAVNTAWHPGPSDA